MHVSYQFMESRKDRNGSHTENSTVIPPSTQSCSKDDIFMLQAQYRAARALMRLKYAKPEESAHTETPRLESEASINPAVNGNSHSEPSLSSTLWQKGSHGPHRDFGLVPITHQQGSQGSQLAQRGECTASLDFGASIVTMSRHTGREELLKPGRRNRSDGRSSVDKLMDEVEAVVGGQPADDAPKEEWDRYLGSYIKELDRRTESGAWHQLEKAQQFVRRMGQAPFRRVNYSSDEEDLPKASESMIPARQKDHTEGTQGNSNEITPTHGKSRNKRRGGPGAKKNEVQTASVDKQAAAAAVAVLELENAKRSTGRSGVKSSIPDIPPPPPSLSAEQNNSQRKKRRRTGLESLESNLGKNWEPHVDERGHRPSRERTKSNTKALSLE
ncbi:uncharacterized protein F4812DRAFT_178974 [Daldinia caldariorum]|uniref:uncharacterized protein n=1 Tax=Daldinia caldariorum TaxID=326644 RepID=UPI002007C5B2|nr:uncharacterized protein F4812DRAFT_178974 [Daldinia caldariorum]KAI1471443.1 hypothetical protein F4812DRAFT_178974 [Daldinia caldariorum]